MEIKHLEYILSLADEKSLAISAQKLSVTPSAISQYLSKLEKELGTALFNRTNSEWTLTDAGKLYVDMARDITYITSRTYSAISAATSSTNGTLRIGLTPGRGPEMFIHVYPMFHESYPNITLEPREMSVVRMQEELRNGGLDLGFMTLADHQKTTDIYIDLEPENLYLCIPDSLPLPGDIHVEAAGFLPPETFKYEPFVLIYKESTGRWAVDQILKNAGFFPNVLFETSSYLTILAMIQAGMCVGFIPEYYVRQNPPGIKAFRIPGAPVGNISVSYRRNSKLTAAEKDLISLAKTYFHDCLVSR